MQSKREKEPKRRGLSFFCVWETSCSIAHSDTQMIHLVTLDVSKCAIHLRSTHTPKDSTCFCLPFFREPGIFLVLSIRKLTFPYYPYMPRHISETIRNYRKRNRETFLKWLIWPLYRWNLGKASTGLSIYGEFDPLMLSIMHVNKWQICNILPMSYFR